MQALASWSSTEVFLSYSRADAIAVRAFARSLRDSSISFYLDESSNRPSEKWRRRIDQEINSSKKCIVFWSRNSISSLEVAYEAEQAHNAGKLIQILIEQVPIPKPYSEFHSMSLIGWDGDPNHPILNSCIAGLTSELIFSDSVPEQLSLFGGPPRPAEIKCGDPSNPFFQYYSADITDQNVPTRSILRTSYRLFFLPHDTRFILRVYDGPGARFFGTSPCIAEVAGKADFREKHAVLIGKDSHTRQWVLQALLNKTFKSWQHALVLRFFDHVRGTNRFNISFPVHSQEPPDHFY